MKRMLSLSAVFHAGIAVFILAFNLNGSPHRFRPQVYRVDLVNLPRTEAAPSVAVKESPAFPAMPPVPPLPLKQAETKESARSKIEAKKPRAVKKPAPSPKPIEPVAAVPPAMKFSAAPPSDLKPSESVAAIPSPEAKIEAKIESPNFKYPYYLIRIQEKIGNYWLPPPLESTTEIKETVVSFVLFPTGKIEEIMIEKSSGNAFMDQAALRAVYQARPMPPFPQGIPDESLKIHFSFSLMKKS